MAGIQKSLKKFKTKNYGIRSAIQKFWYMSGIQAKKSRMKLYTDLFFCRDENCFTAYLDQYAKRTLMKEPISLLMSF